MPPQLPEAVLKRILEEQQRSLGQQPQGAAQGSEGDRNGSSNTAGAGTLCYPQVGTKVGWLLSIR
jgi:hypothetical protein